MTDPDLAPGTITNTAEISAADDDRFGDPATDLDSTPDADPTDDRLVDDVDRRRHHQ